MFATLPLTDAPDSGLAGALVACERCGSAGLFGVERNADETLSLVAVNAPASIAVFCDRCQHTTQTARSCRVVGRPAAEVG